MQGEHCMKAKAEICVMQLQAKELQDFPANLQMPLLDLWRNQPC